MTLKRRRNRNIKLIDDIKSQKLNFRKRKSTLRNKASELATLCDVMVCMVCFGPDGEVVTWPENRSEVRQAFNKFREVGVNVKERESLFRFLEGKKEKLEEKLGRMEWEESRKKKFGKRKGNEGTSFSSWDEKLNLYSEEALMGLCNSLEYKLQNLRAKIQLIQTTENENQKAVKIQDCQPSQALERMNGECSVPPRMMSGDELVLAASGMSEPWPEEYFTNIWTNDDNWLISTMTSNDQPVLAAPAKYEVWNKDCDADAEGSSNNNNCLPPSTMLADQPVLAVATVNSEARSGNKNNTKNNSNHNLFPDPDWFWGTTKLCYLD